MYSYTHSWSSTPRKPSCMYKQVSQEPTCIIQGTSNSINLWKFLSLLLQFSLSLCKKLCYSKNQSNWLPSYAVMYMLMRGAYHFGGKLNVYLRLKLIHFMIYIYIYIHCQIKCLFTLEINTFYDCIW